jgi:hypothetical protein
LFAPSFRFVHFLDTLGISFVPFELSTQFFSRHRLHFEHSAQYSIEFVCVYGYVLHSSILGRIQIELLKGSLDMKVLAISVLLFAVVIATIGVSSSAQPKPLSPPEQRIAKQSGSGDAEKTTASGEEKDSPKNVTTIIHQENSPSHQSDTENEDENIRIQGKLANLTTWLVVAAFIQALILAATIVAIVFQTRANKKIDRPWMAAEMEKPPDEWEPGNFLRVGCHIENVGRSPAFLLEKGDTWRVLNKTETLDETYPAFEKIEKWGGDGILFPPKAEIAIASDVIGDVPRLIYNGDEVLWIYGYIKYRDSFKTDHETRYCFRYFPRFGNRATMSVGLLSSRTLRL